MMKNLFIGLMSGTSMDGIDAALVSFENEKTHLIATHSIPIPTNTKSNLKILLNDHNITLKLLGETDTQLGELFSQAALQLLKKSNIRADKITAIGSHGQTIYHSPNGEHPFTMQLGDPNIIAARTHITTVADFRRRDIALGGQGAPLVPAFHQYLFKTPPVEKETNLAPPFEKGGLGGIFILNLGGIANITYLPADKSKPIIGFDTGPANTLLDQWCECECECECEKCVKNFRAFDEDGHWARSGKLIPELLKKLLNDPYFKKPFPKSTGREYFNLNWLQTMIRSTHVVSAPVADIQHTLTELTAKTIADAITHIITDTDTDTVWLCGGGAKNKFLIERIQKNCVDCDIKSTSEIGVDPQWIECAAFAWLAKQAMEHKAGNIPNVTGASEKTILGGIYFTNIN